MSGTILGLPAAIFLLCTSVLGQQQVSHGPTDNGINPAFSSTYAGGYPVAGIDTVNLYNGHVSLNLPLGKIGARGSVGYSPTLSITRSFELRTYQTWTLAGSQVSYSDPKYKLISEGYMDSYNYSNFQPGLLPAVLIGRRTRDHNPSPAPFAPQESCSTLTKLYLRLAGAQIELRDATGWNGEPHYNTPTEVFTRGKEWHAVDGSGMLFVSDSDISDETCVENGFAAMNGINMIYPTGDLKLEDGTRYRFVQGFPVWMRDRNGNTISFTGLQNPLDVTDSIGRKYHLLYAPSTNTYSPTGSITYKDHNGVDQTVSVTTGNLSTALRTDLAAAGVKTLEQLMPCCVLMENPNAVFDPIVTKTVHLPNGLEYHFFYTEWGELARIELPNGGIIEYDYAGGLVSGTSQVHRNVTAKRVFISAGHLESRQAFSYVFNYSTQTTVKTYDAANILISWERHTFNGNVADDFQFTGWYQPFDSGREITSEVLNQSGSAVLRRVDNTWNTLDLNGAPTTVPQGRVTHPTNFDCALTAVTTTLSDTNQVTKSTLTYDGRGHQTDLYDYDFGTPGSGNVGGFLRRAHKDFNYDSSYTSNTGPYIANMVSNQWVSSDINGANKLAQTEFEYDNYGSLPLISRASISGSCIRLNDTATGCLQASDSFYTLRGNLTKTTAYYDISNNGKVVNTSQYDIAGNLVKTVDARGYTTTFDYDDSFGPPDGNARGNSSPQELAGQYSYAFPTLVTNTLGHTTFTQFNYYIGAPVDNEDANGAVTSLYYDDILDRLTKIGLPDGGRTTYSHVDSHQCGAYVETRTLLDSTGRETDSWQFFDGLGRPYLAESLDNQDPNNPYLRVDAQYDSMGRAWSVSNPYRSAGCTSNPNPSVSWTQKTFDALGRPAKLKTTADSAEVTTDYSGNSVTVTDQHGASSPGRKRKSVMDALGRLSAVYEDPDGSNYLTSYAYDAVGNLRKVEQGGQQRFFMYDSLSRLIRAKNPEQGNFTADAAGGFPSLTDASSGISNSQWSMGYIYDANGNLSKRRDARDVVTTYDYDGLNRNKTVRYTDGTKDIDRFYDGAIKGKGRFWYSNWEQDHNTRFDSHAVIDEYDLMGRPLNYRQNYFTNGVASPPFNVKSTYDKAGNLLTQTYPSGHTVNHGYDIAGRLNSYTGNLGDGAARNYATSITYSEFGGLQQEQFGTQTPLFHKLHYNVRGQLYDIRLSSVAWVSDQWDWNRGAVVNYFAQNYQWQVSDASNNGNVLRSEHSIPLDANGTYGSGGAGPYASSIDTYSYDTLNRLTSVQENQYQSGGSLTPVFTQTYAYDRFGNRTINQSQTSTNVPHPNYTVDPNTNRLVAPAGYNYSYDAAGNQTNDNYTGAGARTYDGENHLKQAWANNQWQTYAYDANGGRIKRNVNGVETWQVYGVGGELLAEYKSGAAPFLPSKEYGYRAGELLVTMSSGDDVRLARFVTNLYYGALQRDPTPTELQDKVNQLAAAGATSQSQLLTTASQIARSLFTSTNYETSPYHSDVQYVSDLYYAYLQRGPDDSGLHWWAVDVLPTSTRTAVCNAFEGSSEFITLVATLYGTAASDNERTEHLVNNFYLGAYGRIATSTELQQQRDALNAAAAQGLSQVQAQAETFGRSLFTAQVNDGSIANTQYVTNLYEAFLQRGPDAGGLSFWSSQATVGTGRQTVLNNFATCGSFRELAGTLYRETFWLVADQLGTPRMIVNKSGTLASVKRHDYLPFGEEIGGPQVALIGGRTTTQGYSGDGVRQKFTEKERDNETGLDYFLARYYSSNQGRFTSADPDSAGASLNEPQSWNGFSYVGNSPLNSTDPFGLWAQVECTSGKGMCWQSDKKSDTITSLALILHIPAKDLNRFFQNPTVHVGDVFDIRGFGAPSVTVRDRGPAVIQVFLVSEPETNGERLIREQREMEAKHAAWGERNIRYLNNLLFPPCEGRMCPRMGIIFPFGFEGPVPITFSGAGQTIGHGARHLTNLGISQAEVEAAITADVRALYQPGSTGSFWGKVTVQGHTIVYRAHTLADGTINIGTYYKP